MRWESPTLDEALDFDRTVLTLPMEKEAAKGDYKIGEYSNQNTSQEYNAGTNGTNGNNGTNPDRNILNIVQSEHSTRILEAIKENHNITLDELATVTSLSRRTVARVVKSMQASGLIKRIGSTRGRWNILD